MMQRYDQLPLARIKHNNEKQCLVFINLLNISRENNVFVQFPQNFQGLQFYSEKLPERTNLWSTIPWLELWKHREMLEFLENVSCNSHV